MIQETSHSVPIVSLRHNYYILCKRPRHQISEVKERAANETREMVGDTRV